MAIPLPNKTHSLPSGHHYSYIHHAPTNPKNPTLLFLHGFPSTSHDWRHQINHFRNQGYGILAPDLLGYGHSSKPPNAQSYVGSIMAADIIGILDHEAITTVIGIAHDWGTYLLSQLSFRYPERLSKLVFMSVPYSPPGRGLDVKSINASTKQQLRFELYGYWMFLTREGSGKIIGANWESFFSLVYAANPSIWKHSFAALGGLEGWLRRKVFTHVMPGITDEDKSYHRQIFGDDYGAATNWYKRGIRNLGVEEEKEALKKGSIGEKIGKETLMITGLGDVICQAAHARSSMQGSVQKGKLRVVDVQAGHWIMLEKVDETNRILQEFFEGENFRSVL